MSFGFSFGDLATLVALTKKTYDGWRDAPKEYADVVQTLSESKMLLCHVERRFYALTRAEENAGKQKEIEDSLKGCQKTISELRLVVKRRRRMGHWDRIRLGSSHVNDCRDRLARHISILTPFLFSLEMESIGKDVGSIPATLERLPQVLLNALPAALGKMIDQRIDDLQTARGSIMTTYGDDDDKQAYKELRRNLRFFGIKDSVVRQQRTKLVEFIKTLTHDDHDTMADDADDDHRVSRKQTAPSPSPTLVPQPAAETAETVCAKDASTTSDRRYQAYAETEDEDESVGDALAVPSNDKTASVSEKAERYTEDPARATHIDDDNGDGATGEPEAVKKTDATPSRHDSTTGAPRLRKYQAYVETEDEDDVLESPKTASDDFLVSPVCSGSSEQTRVGTSGEAQHKTSLPSDIDQDTSRTNPVLETDCKPKTPRPVPPRGIPRVVDYSDDETWTLPKARRPAPPPSTFAVCGDLDYQKSLTSSSDSSDDTDSVAPQISYDGRCSLCDQNSDSEDDDDDDSRGQPSSSNTPRSDSKKGPKVDDHASNPAPSTTAEERKKCFDAWQDQYSSPRRRDQTTNRTHQNENPNPPPSPTPNARSVPTTPPTPPPPSLPQIEYKPLNAAQEGPLTIQLHMPAGYAVHVEGGRVAQFQDRWAPQACRQYFPRLPPYEDYEDYYCAASCCHGFPSAPVPARTVECECQVFRWTPELQGWNPGFMDGLRGWVLEEGVRNVGRR